MYRQNLVLKSIKSALCFVVDSYTFISSCFYLKRLAFVDKNTNTSFYYLRQ